MRVTKIALNFLLLLSIIYLVYGGGVYSSDTLHANDVIEGSMTFAVNFTGYKNITSVNFFVNNSANVITNLSYAGNTSENGWAANLSTYSVSFNTIQLGLTDGSYYFGANITDEASVQYFFAKVIIDNNVPVITSSAPTNGSTVTGNNVMVNFTVTDRFLQSVYFNITKVGAPTSQLGWIYSNGSGLAASPGNFSVTPVGILATTMQTEYTTNLSTSDITKSKDDGLYILHLHANETNGTRERRNKTTLSFFINNNPPQVGGYGGSFYHSTVDFLQANVSGSFVIYVNLTELGSNFDTVRFNITNLSSTARTQVALVTGANSSDASVGATQTTFKGTLTTSTLPDGNYEIIFWSNDTVNGNINKSETRNITIDNLGPWAVNVTSPSAAQVITLFSSLDMNLTINDTTTTVDSVYFNITNESATGVQKQFVNAYQQFNVIQNWNATINSTSLGDGKYIITIYSNDSLNNRNDSQLTRRFRVNYLSPDVQTFNSPAKTLQNVSGNFTVNFTVSELGTYVDSVFINVTNWSGGVQFALVRGLKNGSNLEWNGTFDTGTVSDGNYTITVYVNDTNNLLNNTKNVTIHVDNTKPIIHNVTIRAGTVEIANGSSGMNFSINVSLTESYYDTVIATIQHPDGNETQNITLTRSTGSNDRQFNGVLNSGINTSSLANGIYNVDIFANDSSGNTVSRDNFGAILIESATNALGAPLINNSVTYPSNVSVTVDATAAGNVTLGIRMFQSATGSVTVVGQKTNPTLKTLPGGSMGRFVTVDMDANSSASMQNATVTMTYSDSDIPSGYSEANIVLYHLNEATNTWGSLPPNSFLNTATNTISGVTTSFSTFALGIPSVAAAAASSSSSGGGGGRANVITGITKDIGILPLEGKEVIMSKESTILFKYTYGQEHSIYIDEVNEADGYVTGTLQSTDKDFRIALDETKRLDLNDNGEDDLAVTLTRIYRGRAYLTLQELDETITAESAPPAPEVEKVAEKTATGRVTERVEQAEETVNANKGLIVAILVVLLVVFGGLAFYYHKKHGSLFQ